MCIPEISGRTRPGSPSLGGGTQMTRSIRAAAVLAVLSAAAAPVAAQTNSFAPGAQVNSPMLTGFQTRGDEMVGMQVTIDVAGGGLLSTAWAILGGGLCGGSFGNGFRVTLGCASDSFTGTWSVVGATTERINSVRFNGAPGRTLFDCGWTGQACSPIGQNGGGTLAGTPGSSDGWTLESLGGTFGGTVNGFYTNRVSVGGNAPVGDLYEQLTIQFVGVLGAGNTYNFRADTDNSSFDAPPPTILPEPSTYALMFSGLIGIGVMARRRRNV